MPVRKSSANVSEWQRETDIAIALVLHSFGDDRLATAVDEVVAWDRAQPRAPLKEENDRLLAKWLEVTGEPLVIEFSSK